MYVRCKEGPTATHIEIMERDLMERAKQINIYSVKSFYDSPLFRNNGYTYDPRRKVIVQVVPEAAVAQ